MRSEELRMGNLVMYSADGSIFTVDEISRTGLGVYNDEENTWIEIEEFEGVKLTEEWLKKLGFIYQGSDGYSCLEKSTLLFYFSLRNGLMPSLFYRQTTESDNVKGCMYVHQLQNVFFSLTGTELVYDITSQ